MERQHKKLYTIFCVLGTMLVCFLLLLPSLRLKPVGAQSQTLTDTGREHDLDVKIRSFFDTLAKENSALAFEGLLRQSPLNSFDASQASTDLRNKVDELQTQFGGILGYEKYDLNRVGEDIVIIRYVLKYEHHPTVWTFTFYRKPALTTSLTNTSNSWGVVEVNFDTDMKRLL